MHGATYTTGEFAKLCGTTKNTLFLYDKKGILKPNTTGENGYRYYSEEQYTAYTVIDILKKIGCSLAEIKEYMRSDKMALLQVLNEKREVLTQKQLQLARAKSFIDKIVISAQAAELNSNHLTVKFCAEEYLLVLAYEKVEKEDDDGYAFSFDIVRKLLEYANRKDYGSGLTSGDIIDAKKVSEKDFNPSYSYRKLDFKPDDPMMRIKPAGIYASMYFEDSWENIPKNCEKLLEEIKKGGYSAKEDIYIEDVTFNMLVGNPEGYGVTISTKVE